MKKTRPDPSSKLVSIDEFALMLGMSRASYYRMRERNIPLFPKPVHPNGQGTHLVRLFRSEVEAYLDNLRRSRDGVRPVGRPRKK